MDGLRPGRVPDGVIAEISQRKWSATIVEALNAQEDGIWCEWRGIHGTHQPRRLTQTEFARMLRAFLRP
jgi:hypothetical protein